MIKLAKFSQLAGTPVEKPNNFMFFLNLHYWS